MRDAFTEDAIFVLYGCKTGNNIALLTVLHDLLGVKVIGFRKEIVFCPPPASGGLFVRKGMKIGVNKPGFVCKTDAVTDWQKLISHPDAISVP